MLMLVVCAFVHRVNELCNAFCVCVCMCVFTHRIRKSTFALPVVLYLYTLFLSFPLFIHLFCSSLVLEYERKVELKGRRAEKLSVCVFLLHLATKMKQVKLLGWFTIN